MSLVLLLLAACSYSVRSNAYPYLKGIQLYALENKSSEFSLGEIVNTRLSEAFRDDGRLRQVTKQPDCQLDGVINSFSEKIYSYDSANNVQDYTISISFSVTFTDLQNNQVLYENKSLLISESYAVSEESTSRFKSKTEAINEICDKLFKTIMQNTLETW